MDLTNIAELFPAYFTAEQRAQAQTLFLKQVSLEAHRFYAGKMQTLPKCTVDGLPWFNVWYTPGVSAVSTTIRTDNEASFTLSNRGNLVAVVSDSTRVLGDGDCTPSGGLGVMEGKALLMKYLGGIDAVALCINSKGKDGTPQADKLIDAVQMLQPSFGAINLEDISQPNCYRVLDTLRETCDIPVWHDDAQGTACISLAALLNALYLADKQLPDAKIVFLGAGAANTSIARFIINDGGDPAKLVLFDIHGALHSGRSDLKNNPAFYRQWELCKKTNPTGISRIEDAVRGADVLIALSAPGPGTVKPEWIRLMAQKAIVFACANPVPEIWPSCAKEAGAFIVATGRGDFPNQVNNSVCFPGILKGALLVRSRKITDRMAIRCAHSIADFSRRRGINPDNIIARMDETDVFASEAADVGIQAIEEGVARLKLSWDELYQKAHSDAQAARALTTDLSRLGYTKQFPSEIFDKALAAAITAVNAIPPLHV
ncbi:MAG: NADP-dependent malic enzyme [Spirochaetaceae bacterium]|jgi:malate dehydrogenase (oxaloacetate-decarboxylating)|nr:NADP-dependent malic enzyme [Spirochaetaceae bacterium]